MGDHSDFEGVPSYPDFSRFWEIIENIKLPNSILHQRLFVPWPKRMLIMFKTSFKYFKSNWICWRTNEEAWHWYNDHVGQKMPCSGYLVAN
jgi:acetyl-CoA synthetase